MAKQKKNIDQTLPPGVELIHTFEGHTSMVGRIAWSDDGKLLASPSNDKTVRIWDTKSGKCVMILDKHYGEVKIAAFRPNSHSLVTGDDNCEIILWDADSGISLASLKGQSDRVTSLCFSSSGNALYSASINGQIAAWDIDSRHKLWTTQTSLHYLTDISVDPRESFLALSSRLSLGLLDIKTKNVDEHLVKQLTDIDNSHYFIGSVIDPTGKFLLTHDSVYNIIVYEIASKRVTHKLEGHTDNIYNITISRDGRFICSRSKDNTIRIWDFDSGSPLATIPFVSSPFWPPGLVFHPKLPLVAGVTTPDTSNSMVDLRDTEIRVWDFSDIVNSPVNKSNTTKHYINAKVVLLGDTGVGKTALSIVLTGQPYEKTESTPGRRVISFGSEDVLNEHGFYETRETLLWDLAGQPGYRVIHQLHLNEVAVALVVFDSRSETDPLAGVRHWERALRLAQKRVGQSKIPLKKLLISARNDRGTVSVSKDRLDGLIGEFGFDIYVATSAKEGWQIPELIELIKNSIEWDKLPKVSSSVLFTQIYDFLLRVKGTGKLLVTADDLFADFNTQNPTLLAKELNLKAQFDTCIGRLANRDLIRRLSFGGYVLLQAELLDAYASAMVNTAKEEPDGLGSISEEAALSGKFYVPEEHKVKNNNQEQLLLFATVQELIEYDIALLENADDGRYLVFPSQFNRDYEDAPEPKGKTIAITFDGPVQSLYATLVVRIGHSGFFTTGRNNMWRNAAIFTAKAGGKCGIFLNEFAEARGRLILFFDELANPVTQNNFEEFVIAHATKRSIDNCIDVVRFFICDNCNEPVPDAYVKMLRGKNETSFNCPCGRSVSIVSPIERIKDSAITNSMNKNADRQRDFESFIVSASGETHTPNFRAWAGGERATLAIVFTDIVGSTAMENEVGGEYMNSVRQKHFLQSRKLIDKYRGKEIKTIGDSFMVAFKSVDLALDYALAIKEIPGGDFQLRAGIHVGAMQVEESDVFGSTVNFAARVVGAIKDAEIWLSEQAKHDIDQIRAKRHEKLKWEKKENVEMKGFRGLFTLWAVV